MCDVVVTYVVEGEKWMFIMQRGVVGKGREGKEDIGMNRNKGKEKMRVHERGRKEGRKEEKIKEDIIRHNVSEVVNHIPLHILPNR